MNLWSCAVFFGLLSCGSVLATSYSGLLKQLEVNRIRQEILKVIGRPRLSELSAPVPRIPRAALDVMLRTSVEKATPDTQLMILPTAGNLDCKWFTESHCSRFEYDLSSKVDPSTAKWMVDKSGFLYPENLTVWASCSGEMSLLESAGERDDWLLYSFPLVQNRTLLWGDGTKCEVEISGRPANESEVPQPLLTVLEWEEPARIRKRQASNPNCGMIPFQISFAEIGFEKWIVHPQTFNAGFCKGPCEGVQGHYENLLGLFFGNDPSLEGRYGRCWATCCKPSEYESINLIYLEGDHIFAHRLMTNMIVKSCTCS